MLQMSKERSLSPFLPIFFILPRGFKAHSLRSHKLVILVRYSSHFIKKVTRFIYLPYISVGKMRSRGRDTGRKYERWGNIISRLLRALKKNLHPFPLLPIPVIWYPYHDQDPGLNVFWRFKTTSSLSYHIASTVWIPRNYINIFITAISVSDLHGSFRPHDSTLLFCV